MSYSQIENLYQDYSDQFRNPKKQSMQLDYLTVMEVCENLLPVEIGEWFKAIARYEIFGVGPEKPFEERSLKSYYKRACRELDKNMRNYLRKCEINAANAHKRWNGATPAVNSDDPTGQFTEADNPFADI